MKVNLKFIILVLLVTQRAVFAQNISISGKVTGQATEVLPGVNIQVSGTTIGTVNKLIRNTGLPHF